MTTETTVPQGETNGSKIIPLPFGYNLPDEEVFKRAPREDCDICCLELPNIAFAEQLCYQACCGKMFCIGCMHEIYRKGNRICPFCRSRSEDCYYIKTLEKRAAVGDYKALYNLGFEYQRGEYVKRNEDKMMELFHRAAKLGSVNAHVMLNDIYREGLFGVKISETKADYHMLASAMRGHNVARSNIGLFDISHGHVNRGVKHLLISAGDGFEPSVNILHKLWNLGIAKKDDYDKASLAYKAYLDATTSSRRQESLSIIQHSKGPVVSRKTQKVLRISIT